MGRTGDCMAPEEILGWGAGGTQAFALLRAVNWRVTAYTSVWGSLSLCNRGGAELISFPCRGFMYFGSSLFVASHFRFRPIARFMRINVNNSFFFVSTDSPNNPSSFLVDDVSH